MLATPSYSFALFPDQTLGMCFNYNPIQPVTALYKGLMPLQITFAPQMLSAFIVLPIPSLKCTPLSNIFDN